jgi:hypothetical protein
MVVMRGHEGEGEFVFDPNQVDASSVALPTDEASRMARAREMGFDKSLAEGRTTSRATSARGTTSLIAPWTRVQTTRALVLT